MECWGAQGGGGLSDNSPTESGGKGAYTKGIITLESVVTFYIYVGEKGQGGVYKSNVNGSWNGGGKGCHDGEDDESAGAGGGATDIRLINGTWDNFISLKSQLMVAGAGGGGSYYNSSDQKGNLGGHGGGLEGGKAKKWNKYNNTYVELSGIVGTQTGGYVFGQGQNATQPGKNNDYGGGGGGWYGGSLSVMELITWAGSPGHGGSSYISGHTGCDAISSSSTSSNIIHTGQPNHYSGYVFTNTVMKAGNESMPSPTGGTETGHSGNGYCKITWHPTL